MTKKEIPLAKLKPQALLTYARNQRKKIGNLELELARSNDLIAELSDKLDGRTTELGIVKKILDDHSSAHNNLYARYCDLTTAFERSRQDIGTLSGEVAAYQDRAERLERTIVELTMRLTAQG